MAASLPERWISATLIDVADIVMGNSPPGTSYNKDGRGVPLINGPTEFGPGPLDHPRVAQYTEAPSRFCEPGDLLVCVRGSTTGRTNVASFRACIGRGLAAVRAYECQPFINYYVSAQQSHLLSIGTGSTFPSISATQLRALPVPLPPLSDQKHIVEALHQALTDLDAGVQSLQQAREDLVELRASVLQAAFCGDLTRRDSDKPRKGESAHSLLARIRAQRHAHLSTPAQQDPAPTQPPAASNTVSSTRELPDGWTEAPLGDLCDIQLGQARNPANRADRFATPYLRAANITDDGLDLSNVLMMDFPPHQRELYRLRRGDLLLSEASGSPSQVGKPAVWNDELALCCFQNTVIRLRPVLLSSEYILTFLQHCYFNGLFAELAAGVGINHLGAGRLAQILAPLPPADEQAALVAEVNRHLGAARASRTSIDANLELAELLRRSVLERAFAGDLVMPVASSESASGLIIKMAKRRSSRASTKSQRTSETRSRTPVSDRRPLLDVIREHPEGITPEQLLEAAHFTLDMIDEFYEELAQIADSLIEKRPEATDLVNWPTAARVLLRATLE